MARAVSGLVAVLGLLALGPVHAKAPEAHNASGKPSEIDAFLENLQQSSQAPSKQPQAETPVAEVPAPSAQSPQPTPAAPVSSPVVPSVEPLAPSVDAEALRTPERPRVIGERLSPVRTLLLMLGGIAVLALAIVGLTLAFVALRKDMRQRRRARQRRFVPYPPKKPRRAGPN